MAGTATAKHMRPIDALKLPHRRSRLHPNWQKLYRVFYALPGLTITDTTLRDRWLLISQTCGQIVNTGQALSYTDEQYGRGFQSSIPWLLINYQLRSVVSAVEPRQASIALSGL